MDTLQTTWSRVAWRDDATQQSVKRDRTVTFVSKYRSLYLAYGCQSHGVPYWLYALRAGPMPCAWLGQSAKVVLLALCLYPRYAQAQPKSVRETLRVAFLFRGML